MSCDSCDVASLDVRFVNHRSYGLRIYFFFGGIRLGNTSTGMVHITSSFAGPVHAFDPVSDAIKHTFYVFRAIVAHSVLPRVLLNAAGDAICLGLSLGCTAAST